MLARQGVGLVFLGQFTETKLGKTGLTVTADVWRISSTGTVTSVTTNGAAFAVGRGVYGYALTSTLNNAPGVWLCVLSTSTTSVDQREIPACWMVEMPAPVDVMAWKGVTPNDLNAGRIEARLNANSIEAGTIDSVVAPSLANLDATVSSISASGWTGAEKSQIRYRLGVDGSQATPVSAANLSTLTSANVWSHTSRTLTGSVSVDATSKEGIKLASDGLDAISADEPTGAATTFRGKLVQVWARFFRKTRRTTTAIEVYQANGTSIATSQAWSETNGIQQVGGV